MVSESIVQYGYPKSVFSQLNALKVALDDLKPAFLPLSVLYRVLFIALA